MTRVTPRGFVVGDRLLQSTDSHADLCAAFGEALPFRLFGASAIGKLHVRQKRPRDDAFAARYADNWLAVAVSDGVGSRKLSRYGACLCVEVLCEQLLRQVQSHDAPDAAPENGASTEAENVAPIAVPKELAALSRTTSRTTSKRRWHEELKKFLPFAEKAALCAVPDQALSARREWGPGTMSDFSDGAGVLLPQQTEMTFGTLQGGYGGFVQEDALPDRAVGLSEDRILAAFRQTYRSLNGYVETCGLTLADVSCTLLGLLLNTSTGEVAVGHIGDGLIAMMHPAMGTLPVVTPPAPEDAGAVYPFTHRDWEKHLSIRVLDPDEAEGITGYFLMSDGVAEDCTHAPPENILQLWAGDINRELRKEQSLPQTAAQLAHWLSTYDAPASWDDRTLVAILRC